MVVYIIKCIKDFLLFFKNSGCKWNSLLQFNAPISLVNIIKNDYGYNSS